MSNTLTNAAIKAISSLKKTVYICCSRISFFSSFRLSTFLPGSFSKQTPPNLTGYTTPPNPTVIHHEYSIQFQTPRKAQKERSYPLLCSELNSVFLFRMAVKFLPVKHCSRAEYRHLQSFHHFVMLIIRRCQYFVVFHAGSGNQRIRHFHRMT